MKISEKIAILIGVLLFVIFVTGLAWSISNGLAGFTRSIPFWIIVIFCIILLFYDSYKAIKK
jgi:lipoprotein signal peptidase